LIHHTPSDGVKEKKKKKKAEADFFDPTAQPPSPGS
jgi:hypothetical protein